MVLLFGSGAAYAQSRALSNSYGEGKANKSRENLIGYDDRLLTYGFTLGMHTSTLRIKFSEEFTGSRFDSVANIVSPNGFGFSIGFLASLRAAQYLDVRVMPKVGFYQYSVDLQDTNVETPDQNYFADFTTIDLPVMFKFKSQRRKNFRMFYVAGVTPTIDVTGKKQRQENAEEGLRLTGDNLSMEIGFGTDIYFPLFKFSPEIRYSYGLVDVLQNSQNDIGQAFQRLNTQGISLYLIFN
jgi:hypothetical protein